MRHFWRFVSTPENQRALSFVGTGIAAAVVAGWTLFVYLDSAKDPSVNLSPQQVEDLVSNIEARILERFDRKIEEAENGDPAKKGQRIRELEALRELELSKLDALKSNASATTTETNRVLSEILATISVPVEVLDSNEIDTAYKQIKSGDITAAEGTLTKYSKKLASDAAQAEFLLGNLAEEQADLEVAVGHYKRSIVLDSSNINYKKQESKLYKINIVYDSNMRDKAVNMANFFSKSNIYARIEYWYDFSEEDDGAMNSWFSFPVLIYGENTGKYVVEELEKVIIASGEFESVGYKQGPNLREGTGWTFPETTIQLWLPNGR